ncbi:MAG: hypothetical protein KBD25_00865 [Rickettsiaceae bacterium]|nr:hypothetical protein [Rickettsiaceae bacterium]
MKTKTEVFTYELVSAKIKELHDAGEKITVKNVLSKTDGSVGKIADFIKCWKDQNRMVMPYRG